MNWKLNSKYEAEIITKIANRAKDECNHPDSIMTINMDITACHLNGNPLDLTALLNADSFDFAHDVLGIRRHINRKTGKLENCFLPRYSE